MKRNPLSEAIDNAPLPDEAQPIIVDLNFNPKRFQREFRRAALPSHVVETQEEADKMTEWVRMVTGIHDVEFKVGERYFLLPMHA